LSSSGFIPGDYAVTTNHLEETWTGQAADGNMLWQVLIPSLHEGQNPLVIASEGARSPTGRSAPPLGRTELLLNLRVNDDSGNEVASTPFEWGVSNDPRLHDSGTVMWSFDDVGPGAYDVFADARTDPVPGAPGTGNTNNNPSAVLENCALTVFVIPAA
jgi:hypothetical protein